MCMKKLIGNKMGKIRSQELFCIQFLEHYESRDNGAAGAVDAAGDMVVDGTVDGVVDHGVTDHR